MENGYIKFFRSIKDWRWYKDNNTKSLFIHCLVSANHKDNEWKDILVKSGSFITSYQKLAEELGLTIQQVRTSIKRLNSTHEITYKTTNKYSVINVENWAKYQLTENEINTVTNTQPNNQITNKQQTNNNQITTNKNEKNEKNDNNEKNNKDIVAKATVRFIKPTLEEVSSYCKEKGYSVDPESFIAFYESKGWKVGNTPMKNWKSALVTWEKRNQKPKQQDNKFKDWDFGDEI